MPAKTTRSKRPSKNKSNKRTTLLRSSFSLSSVRAKFIAAVVVLAVVVTGIQIYNASHASNRSGLPWKSGAFSNDEGDGVEEFGNWRGAPSDVYVTWPPRQTWNDFINDNWAYQQARSHPNLLPVLGIPPIPGNDGGATVAQCATGAYNAKWKTFANTMNTIDGGNVIVRLGWEFNGNWYNWGGQNPNDFKNCWNQIVGTVKPIAPKIKWDWNVNRGPSAGMSDPTQAYPGDANVDIVGIDSYNRYGDWATMSSSTNQGLYYWLNFAKAHGKPLSVPEWAETEESGNNGDVAWYIDDMYNFFKANAANIAYEAYFNEKIDYRGAIYNPIQKPIASAEYKKIWKTAVGTGTGATPAPTAKPTPVAATPAPQTGGNVSQTGNLARGKTVKSSAADSSSEPGNPASYTVDGNESTRWISTPTNGATLTVDLGASYKLTGASILWAGDTVNNYSIQTSTDNANWSNIYTGATSKDQQQKYLVKYNLATTGRYFRVVASDRWNANYGNSIWEIGVYGSAAGGTVTPAPTPAPTQAPAPAASASGALVAPSLLSKCLDNNASQAVNGNKIQLYACNGTGAQHWTIQAAANQQIKNANGMCLASEGSKTTSGTPVQLWACNSAAGQRWTFNKSTGTIVNTNSGLCLDIKSSGTANGTPAQIYTCNGTGAQKWKLE